MDHEFKRKLEEKQRRALQNRQIRDAIQSGELTVLDRIGYPIVKGAKIAWHPPNDLIFDVKDVTPILDPGAQPGAMRLTLIVEVPVAILAGMPEQSMIRVWQQTVPAQVAQEQTPAPTGEEDVPLPLEELPQSD